MVLDSQRDKTGMAANMPPLEHLQGNAALSALPPADERSHQPDFVAIPDPDPNDTTSIPQGSALFGRGSWSAGRMAVNETFALYERAQKQKKDEEDREARELANLEFWSRQKTVIGGVETTNGEAQEARQRVIDNGDRYADWAVQQGHIRDDEKDAFKAAMRGQRDLEEKRGRGTMTPEEEREAEAVKRSRMGGALDAATAEDHVHRGRQLDANVQRNDANAALRRDAGAAITAYEDAYRASTATVSMAAPLVQSADQRVKTTGLDL